MMDVYFDNAGIVRERENGPDANPNPDLPWEFGLHLR